jgi:hypothetical protein
LLTRQKLYISHLDSSLIASIVSDTGSFEEAQKILEPLAQASVSEEKFQENLTYGSGPPGTVSSDEEDVKADALSEAEVFQFLRITFPKHSDSELRRVVNLCDGSLRKAVDTLLNTEYIDSIKESHPDTDGIDTGDNGDENSIWAQRRPGGVARPKAPLVPKTSAFPSLAASSQLSSRISRSQSPGRSKWDVLDSQIAFLSQSLSLPPARVRSAFHTNASSLPRTLRDLLKDIPPSRADKDVVSNMKSSFKQVDEDLLQKIVASTNHDLDSAMELARILDHDKYFTTPLQRADLPKIIPTKTHPTSPFKGPDSPRVVDDGEGSLEDMNSLKLHYLQKRNESFTAASQAYRRSKSDVLTSGVASYYASLGHEYDVKYRHYAQVTANRLVASSSSGNKLDLHGASIKDALRILEEAITLWWSRVEVLRERGEVKALRNFVVIVGQGQRNKGGSRLGPSVGGWLRRNGWGFQEAKGEFIVWGLRRDPKKTL